MVLDVRDLTCGYGKSTVLEDVSLRVDEGGFACVLGSNNAGKSTLINCLSGIVPATSGSVHLRGRDITAMPAHQRVEQGLVQVPEGRQLFPDMTVADNLLMGAVGSKLRKQGRLTAKLDEVFELFERLAERSGQLAGSLSGGEQQMLAIARALMAEPDVLILDEPSLGLAPLVVESIFGTLAGLNRNGRTILLVEQNLTLALQYAKTGYVLERGRVMLHGTSDELTASDQTRKAYLGM